MADVHGRASVGAGGDVRSLSHLEGGNTLEVIEEAESAAVLVVAEQAVADERFAGMNESVKMLAMRAGMFVEQGGI